MVVPHFEKRFLGSVLEAVYFGNSGQHSFEHPFKPDQLPTSLLQAAPSRVESFWAGRLAAHRALQRLGETLTGPLERLPSGQALWPNGFFGSITHSGHLAAALVLRSETAHIVGLDYEGLLTERRAQKIRLKVADDDECALFESHLGLDVAISLIFSAKETIFKAVFPLVQRFFGFSDYRLKKIDFINSRLIFECAISSGDESFPRLLVVDYALDEIGVWTALVSETGAREGDQR